MHVEQVMFRSGPVRCAGCQWFPERQVEDLRAGVSYLQTRPEVDPERIGAWGHSTAAGVAIVAGARPAYRRGRLPEPQHAGRLGRPGKSRGRGPMGMIRGLLRQDFERRFETGEGAAIPALPAGDPRLAGYLTQAERLFPTFRNQMTVASLEHVLPWAPVQFIHRLAPTPLLMVTGVDDQVHAIDEVLAAYHRAWQPKRLELLQVDELGLSIEPGLGQSMGLAVAGRLAAPDLPHLPRGHPGDGLPAPAGRLRPRVPTHKELPCRSHRPSGAGTRSA